MKYANQEEDISVEKEKTVRKFIKSKQHSITDSEPTETAVDLEKIPLNVEQTLPVETSKQIAESIPESTTTELGESKDKKEKKIDVKFIPLLSVETNEIVSGDKEVERVPVLTTIPSQAEFNMDANEPVTVSVTNVQESADDFTTKFKPISYNASPAVVPSESLIVSEINTDQDVVDTRFPRDDSKEARVVLSTHIAAVTEEIRPSFKEENIDEPKLPSTVQAQTNFVAQEGISVTEVNPNVSEFDLPDLMNPMPVSPRLEILPSESILVTEIFSEIKPEKYYPELIVPTEVADGSIVPGNKLAQNSEMLLPEKEGTLIPMKIPEEKHAELKLSLDKSILISEQHVHEKEKSLLPQKQVQKNTVSTTFTPFESLEISEVEGEIKEEELLIEKVDIKKGDIVIEKKESIIATINTPIEREQSLSPESNPSTKKANLKLNCLETSNVSETVTNESETFFESTDIPKGIYPLTSIQPLESIEITETNTGDVPTDFVTPLKYSTDKATTSFETVESKEIAQIVTEEKESPLLLKETPLPKTVTQEISGLKSIEITQTQPAEKEDVLKVDHLPESHKGRSVPGHPFHSLIVEEINSDNTTGVVKHESLPLHTVKVKQDTHQETVIQEIVCDESVSESNIKQSHNVSADFAMVPEESIEVTEVFSNEKEQNFDQPGLPHQVFAEKSLRPQEALQTSEVLTNYEPSSFSLKSVPKSVAIPGTTPFEGISVTQYETSEKESILAADIHPELKIATLDFHDGKREVQITQVETGEREEDLNVADQPKSFTASASISGHVIAVKTEIQPEQNYQDLSVPEEKKRLASVGNVPHQEVVITEVNVSEQEKDFAQSKPGQNEAVVALMPEEAVSILEIVSADSEGFLMKDQEPACQTANTIVLQQNIAEKSETVANISTGILERSSPEKANANILHDALQHVIQAELITGEKESEIGDFLKPNLKSAKLNFEEEKALCVTEVNTSDIESLLEDKDLPKKSFASFGIKSHKVAAVSETFVEQSTGDMDLFAPTTLKAKLDNVPFEAIENIEVLPSESEGQFRDEFKPHLQKVMPSFDKEIGLPVSIVGQNVVQEKEEQFEEKPKPSFKTASVTLQELKKLPTIEDITLSDGTSPLIIRVDEESHALPDVQNQTVVAQQYEVITNLAEGSFISEVPNTKTASLKMDTFEGVVNTEIIGQDSETKLPEENKPCVKTADSSIETLAAASTFQIEVQDSEQKYIVEEPEEQNASSNFIPSLVAENMEINVDQDISDIITPVTELSLAKSTIIPHKSIIQSTIEVSESEKQFIDKFKVVEQTASIQVTEDTSIDVSEVQPAEKEDLLFLNKKHQPVQAQPTITGQKVAITTETVPSLSVSHVKENETPIKTTATIEQTPLVGLTQTQVEVLDKEQDFKESLKTTTQSVTVNIQESQSINVTTHTLSDSADVFNVSEKPSKVSAQVEISTIDSIQQTDVRAESYIEPLDIHVPKSVSIVPTQTVLEGISVSENIIHESESELQDHKKPHASKAKVELESQIIASVCEIDVQDKEGSIPFSEIPKKAQPTLKFIEQKVAQKSETIPVIGTTELNNFIIESENALETTVPLEHIIQTQPYVQEPSETELRTTQSDSKTGTVQIESRTAIASKIEILAHEKENELTAVKRPTLEKAHEDIIDQEALISSEIVTLENTKKLTDFKTPHKKSATEECIPFESIEQTEVLVQESDDILNLNEKNIERKGEAKFQEVVSVSIQEIIAQEKEGESTVHNIPTQETATVKLPQKESLQSTEVIADSSVSDISNIPAELKTAKVGMSATQQSLEVSMVSPQEHEEFFVEKETLVAKAPVVVQPLDSIQIIEITPDESLGKFNFSFCIYLIFCSLVVMFEHQSSQYVILLYILQFIIMLINVRLVIIFL